MLNKNTIYALFISMILLLVYLPSFSHNVNADGNYSPLVTTLLSDGFEGNVSANWSETNLTGSSPQWFLTTSGVYPTCSPHNGAYMMWYDSWDLPSDDESLLSCNESVDLSSVSSAYFSFWMYHDSGYSTQDDRISVQMYINGTLNWTTLDTFHRYNISEGWQCHEINISVYAGSTNPAYFRLLGHSDYGDNMYVDDIYVSDIPVLSEMFVDDNFNSSTLGWGLNHFNTIQDGVSNVSSGGTVFVYDGNYYGTVAITKPMTVVGEDKNNVLVHGRGETILGLSPMQNHPLIGPSAEFLWGTQSTSNVLIQNMTFDDTGYAISLVTSDNCQVDNCKFTNILCSDILIYDSTDITVTNNTCNAGIMIWQDSGTMDCYTTHTIENNFVGGQPIEYYINQNNPSIPSNASQVIAGNCTNLTLDGLTLLPLSLGWCNHTIVNNSDLREYDDYGSFLHELDGINISNCKLRGWEMGILLISVNNFTIVKNSIYETDMSPDYSSASINIRSSSNGVVYNNNFYCNDSRTYIYDLYLDATNAYANGTYAQGGNYYGDYHNASQGAYDNNSDGYADSPWDSHGANPGDSYPLMNPKGAYPAWDINQDGTVNYLDVSLFVSHYGESGTPGWIPDDINSDGVVNYLDLSLLVSHYGE